MFLIICTSPIFLGGLAYITGRILDQTEMKVKKRTSELEKANKHAHKLVKNKSEFLASMSHELRTPLNGILGMTEALSQEKLSEKQYEYLDLITYSGKNLLTIINELLDYSKLQANKMKINSHSFDLETLIAGVESSFSLQAESKGIQFLIEKNKNIPKTIICDDTRIFQILNNIIKIIENSSTIPLDIIDIIADHHESSLEEYFNTNKPASRISQLTAIFIISDQFCHIVHEEEKVNMELIKEDWSRFYDHFNKANFKKPLECLKKIIFKEIDQI